MIVVWYKQYLNVKLLNLMSNSLSKIRQCLVLFLIGGTLYMLYGKLRTKYMKNKCYRQSPWIPKFEERLCRDECLLFQFTTQPPSIELSLPTRHGIIPRDAVWQSVHLTKFKFFIYSAYLDTRMESIGPVIRIIAITEILFSDTVWCRLWYSNSSKTVSAFVYITHNRTHLPYTSSFVLCKLPSDRNIGNYPLSVSVVSHIQDPITNEVLIQIPNKTNEFKTDIEICVKPFHSHYSTETRLMEFIELYYLLGARHFTFYNGSVMPNVQCVLDQYKDDNLISVLPWQLDLVSNVDIRTEEMHAAINDCLYRKMYTSRYILFVDVDEMIIPKPNVTLIQLIDLLNSKFVEKSNIYSYSFLYSLFCMEWSDDKLSPFNHNQTETNLVVLRKTYRKGVIPPHGIRSKYICDPRRVLEAGNNFVWEFLNQYTDKIAVAPIDIALLHHYRTCNNTPIFCEPDTKCNVLIVVDRTVYKYKDKLVDRIKSTRNRLNKSCVLT